MSRPQPLRARLRRRYTAAAADGRNRGEEKETYVMKSGLSVRARVSNGLELQPLCITDRQPPLPDLHLYAGRCLHCTTAGTPGMRADRAAVSEHASPHSLSAAPPVPTGLTMQPAPRALIWAPITSCPASPSPKPPCRNRRAGAAVPGGRGGEQQLHRDHYHSSSGAALRSALCTAGAGSSSSSLSDSIAERMYTS